MLVKKIQEKYEISQAVEVEKSNPTFNLFYIVVLTDDPFVYSYLYKDGSTQFNSTPFQNLNLTFKPTSNLTLRQLLLDCEQTPFHESLKDAEKWLAGRFGS